VTSMMDRVPKKIMFMARAIYEAAKARRKRAERLLMVSNGHGKGLAVIGREKWVEIKDVHRHGWTSTISLISTTRERCGTRTGMVISGTSSGSSTPAERRWGLRL
jgi:hypothetical protein